jgi:hypothetical protein
LLDGGVTLDQDRRQKDVEQLVGRRERHRLTRVAVSPELSAWIAARIAAFPAKAAEQLRWEAPYVSEAKALPLYLGWFETIGIRADGEIVRWSTEGEYPGVQSVEDRYVWLSSLVDASRRYPELRVLLPTRPVKAVDCRHLSHPIFAEGKVFCPECCGLGWVDAADAEHDPPTDLPRD